MSADPLYTPKAAHIKPVKSTFFWRVLLVKVLLPYKSVVSTKARSTAIPEFVVITELSKTRCPWRTA